MTSAGVEYICGKHISIDTIYDLSEGGIIYDGYLHSEDYPCESVFDIMAVGITDNYFHVKILTKTVLKETSRFFEDDDGARICLFPTAKLHLKWNILAKNLSREYMIKQLELLGR